MATISFISPNGPLTINDLSGSGLGFYGSSGFGASVQVGSFQDNTYITNGAGTSQGPQGNNIKYLNIGSGIVSTASSGIPLISIPNYQATLNIRFSHSSAVRVQNWEARIYDRTSSNNPASGVTCKVAELIHPGTTQVPTGSGDTLWIGITTNPQTGTATVGGSGITVTLANSPGASGQYAGNGSTSTRSDYQHDTYLCISASPDSVGSKTLFGLYTSLEYL